MLMFFSRFTNLTHIDIAYKYMEQIYESHRMRKTVQKSDEKSVNWLKSDPQSGWQDCSEPNH